MSLEDHVDHNYYDPEITVGKSQSKLNKIEKQSKVSWGLLGHMQRYAVFICCNIKLLEWQDKEDD